MQPHTYALVSNPASLEELIQKAKTFVAAAKAPATLKAYRNDWRDFESWCRAHQLPSLPSTPESVALYIADRASTLASGTIARRLTSITKAHQAAGFTDSPATTRHFVVGETLKGSVFRIKPEKSILLLRNGSDVDVFISRFKNFIEDGRNLRRLRAHRGDSIYVELDPRTSARVYRPACFRGWSRRPFLWFRNSSTGIDRSRAMRTSSLYFAAACGSAPRRDKERFFRSSTAAL
jgi:hypothetical protein